LKGPISLTGISNIELIVEGDLEYLANIKDYPFINGAYPDLFTCVACDNITFTGRGGSFDGYLLSDYLFRLQIMLTHNNPFQIELATIGGLNHYLDILEKVH
jgi:hypothetical protein